MKQLFDIKGNEKHVGEMEGKEINECKIESKEMHEKRNRMQGNQGQGVTPPPRGGAKGGRPEAKDLCARCQGAGLEGGS